MSAAEHTPHELQTYDPPADMQANAWVSGMDAYDALCAEAEADHEAFWARQARELLTLEDAVHARRSTPATRRSSSGSTTARSTRRTTASTATWRPASATRSRSIFEADDGSVTRVTYEDLLARTCRMANALKARGVKKGDRVVIYMSMSVEGVVAMQACARIGATHSVVFGGFSAQSLRDRIEDTGAVMVITADEQQRGGKHAAAQGHRRRRDRAGRLRLGQGRHRLQAHRRRHRLDAARPLAARRHGRGRRHLRARVGRRRAPAVPALHLRLHRQAQGRAALHRRLPAARGAHHQVDVRPEGRRRLLVHRRHRLGHRPHLHRLRPAGARRHRDRVRGRAHVPGRRPLLEDDPGPQGHQVLHRAHGDPLADQGGRGQRQGAPEVLRPDAA